MAAFFLSTQANKFYWRTHLECLQVLPTGRLRENRNESLWKKFMKEILPPCKEVWSSRRYGPVYMEGVRFSKGPPIRNSLSIYTISDRARVDLGGSANFSTPGYPPCYLVATPFLMKLGDRAWHMDGSYMVLPSRKQGPRRHCRAIMKEISRQVPF